MASLKKQLEIESKSGADLGAGHSVCISDVKCRHLCSRLTSRSQLSQLLSAACVGSHLHHGHKVSLQCQSRILIS